MGDVKLNNPRPFWEVGILYLIFLGAGLGGLWWLLTLLPLSQSLILPLGALGSLIWAVGGLLVIRKVTKDDGQLTLHPETQTFTLNKRTYPYSSLNVYKSSLVAPKILETPGGYSSQHITLGVDKNVYRVGDDVAIKNFTQEGLKQLHTLIESSALDIEQKSSFYNWLQRVQVGSKHTTQTPEDN